VLRLSSGLRLVMQSYPPFGLTKFLFVGSENSLATSFTHNVTVTSLWRSEERRVGKECGFLLSAYDGIQRILACNFVHVYFVTVKISEIFSFVFFFKQKTAYDIET